MKKAATTYLRLLTAALRLLLETLSFHACACLNSNFAAEIAKKNNISNLLTEIAKANNKLLV
jgi:hypothetical protein